MSVAIAGGPTRALVAAPAKGTLQLAFEHYFDKASDALSNRFLQGLFYDAHRRFKASIKLAQDGEHAAFSEPYNPGIWRHLAMVVDDENKLLYLYVDGRKARGSPRRYAGALADLKPAKYYVGTSNPLAERWDMRFRGAIDEVRIYGRALSAEEVRGLAHRR